VLTIDRDQPGRAKTGVSSYPSIVELPAMEVRPLFGITQWNVASVGRAQRSQHKKSRVQGKKHAMVHDRRELRRILSLEGAELLVFLRSEVAARRIDGCGPVQQEVVPTAVRTIV